MAGCEHHWVYQSEPERWDAPPHPMLSKKPPLMTLGGWRAPESPLAGGEPSCDLRRNRNDSPGRASPVPQSFLLCPRRLTSGSCIHAPWFPAFLLSQASQGPLQKAGEWGVYSEDLTGVLGSHTILHSLTQALPGAGFLATTWSSVLRRVEGSSRRPTPRPAAKSNCSGAASGTVSRAATDTKEGQPGKVNLRATHISLALLRFILPD